MSFEAKLERALASVHAAIADPRDEPLRAANRHAIEVLEAWSGAPPALHAQLAALTEALRRLRHRLPTLPPPSPRREHLDAQREP